MNTLLVAINAKYSHTNLAVRYLQNALADAGIAADFTEYTINQPSREILADIVSRRPDRLLFSCYLWNIEYVRRIGADFRKLFPQAEILLGGPEVSFEAQEQLACMPWADAILCGEGETVAVDVLRMEHPQGVFSAEEFVSLDALPFPYQDLSALSNRVLYYESTRGCPFGCSYCLSSADRTTRFRSLSLVYADLQRFLDANVMQVKFVDRTFNLDGARALSIWRYLAAHDNGVTSFQMELGGDLLSEREIVFLSGVRKGLFQFEIGVQSTCEATLSEIARVTDIAQLRRNVAAIQAAGNIHQHLDLIAGLPMETFERFMQSYDEVFAMRPQQLQLGFLKLLRGSKLYAQREQYGLVHSDLPPYEILSTPQISFAQLAQLKQIEEMTEVYYNSGRFSHTLEYLLRHQPSAFQMFLSLADTIPQRSVGKYEYYDLLFAFCGVQGGDTEICRWLIKFDLALHERPRRLPVCCGQSDLTQQLRREISALRLPKTGHAEVFPFDVTDPAYAQVQTAIAFDYTCRDGAGHACFKEIAL